MADEVLAIDDNNKNAAGAVTDDAAQEIRNLRIDDATKGLKVIVVGGIGAGTVTSIAAGTGILATPDPIIATGTIALATALQPMASLAGHALQVLRVNAGETAVEYGTTTSGYDLIENNGVAVAARTTINLSTLLTATDSGGKTALTINVTNLANDATFISTLTGNATFISDIVDIVNNSGSITINLATQVTGTLTVPNGGTGATTLTGVLHGNGTSAVTAIPLTTDGAILIGDGAGAPTTLAAFSSATGTLNVANGGTGIASYAVGDIIYASGATTLAKLADVATGNALISGGVGVAPAYGKIGLTTHISGTLAVGNGGTGATTLTGLVQGNGASAMTTVTDSSTVGQVLRVTGASTYAWGALDLADPDAVTGILPAANLPASASGIYTVNADETINSYYSYQVPLLYNDAVATDGFIGFTNTNIGDANGQGAGGAVEIISSGGNSSITAILPGVVFNNDYRPSNNKIIRIKGRFALSTTANIKSFGMADAAATMYADETSIDENFRFVENAGTLYATNADGTGVTSTDVSAGITRTNMNTYEIVFDPVGGGTPNAKFYINGTLVATHTTNLELGAVDFFLGYGLNTTTQYIKAFPPIVSLQM